MNSKLRHRFILTLYASVISPKWGSRLNTRSNHFTEHVMSRKKKITLGVAVRGECGVANEGRVVGVPKVLFLE